MKIIKLLSIFLFSAPLIMLGDTPWHTVSFGILGDAGSATFHTEKIFFGVEAHKLSLDGAWTDEDCEWIYSYYVCEDISKSISVSAWILEPRIGKRIKLKSSDRIASFIDIEGYMAFPFIGINIDTDDDDISASDISTAENIIDDLLDFMGFKVSYGIKYEINSQISLSTSVGFNHIIADFSEDDIELDSNMGSTYTKFEINYSF